MSNGGGGNKRNRGGGGGGGGNQPRRRRSGGGGGGGQNRPQAPHGPAMTALGESTYEAVFDHGGSGYGVWFDGVVRDDPMYKQFWKGTGTRPLYVRIEEDKIVLLKELDRDLPPIESEGGGSATPAGLDDADVNAAIEEAVAEAMAAAEAAAGDGEGEERTYTPEEAAALFAEGGDQAVAEADAAAAEPEAEAKPKKRAVRKKAAPKKDADE